MGNVATKQKKLFSISKQQIRYLVSATERPMPISSFQYLMKKWRVAEKLGMSIEDFRNTKVFYFEHYETLKKIIGFDDDDLF